MLIFSLGFVFGTTDLPADLREKLFNTLNPVFGERCTRMPLNNNFSMFQRSCMAPFLNRNPDIDCQSVYEGLNLFLFITQDGLAISSSNTLRHVIDFYVQNAEIDDQTKQQFKEFNCFLEDNDYNFNKIDL